MTNPLKSQIATNRERFDEEFQCEKCLSEGKDITHYEELPVIRRFLTTSQTSLLQTAIAAVEEIETTFGISGSDSYEIGRNHGRQEYKAKVVELLKGGITE